MEEKWAYICILRELFEDDLDIFRLEMVQPVGSTCCHRDQSKPFHELLSLKKSHQPIFGITQIFWAPNWTCKVPTPAALLDRRLRQLWDPQTVPPVIGCFPFFAHRSWEAFKPTHSDASRWASQCGLSLPSGWIRFIYILLVFDRSINSVWITL